MTSGREGKGRNEERGEAPRKVGGRRGNRCWDARGVAIAVSDEEAKGGRRLIPRRRRRVKGLHDAPDVAHAKIMEVSVGNHERQSRSERRE